MGQLPTLLPFSEEVNNCFEMQKASIPIISRYQTRFITPEPLVLIYKRNKKEAILKLISTNFVSDTWVYFSTLYDIKSVKSREQGLKRKTQTRDRKRKIEGLNRYELMVISVNTKDTLNSSSPIFSPRKIIDRELYTNKKELSGWRISKKSATGCSQLLD